MGDGSRFLVDATAPDEMGQPTRTVSVLTVSGAGWKQGLPGPWHDQVQVHGSRRFYPYFHWLRTRKRIRLFPIKGDVNHAFTDDLRYMSELRFGRPRRPLKGRKRGPGRGWL